MKHALSATLAVFLIALRAHPASAQPPALTNADVVHLVATRISDQTLIAVIQEAVATEFDLSPEATIELAGHDVPVAVIGAMRRSSTVSPAPAAADRSAISEPRDGGQTLAGAAAEAAAAAQARGLTASPSLELSPPTITPPVAIETAAAAAPAPDEADWRARVGSLHLTLRDNRAKEGPLLNRINSLTVELSGMEPSNVKRRSVETEKQRVTTELTALRESLRANLAAIQAVEEDGRQAGVPPAWLR